MRNVQPQLALQRIPEPPRVGSRSLGADKDLTVLKRNYIRRPWKMKKPAVQFRHPPFRDEVRVQLRLVCQAAVLFSRNLETVAERTLCEPLQRRDVNTDGPLAVVNVNPGCRANRLTCLFSFHACFTGI